jgi:hypothetical protein
VSESIERSEGDRGGVDMIELGVRERLVVVVVVVWSDTSVRRYAAESETS